MEMNLLIRAAEYRDREGVLELLNAVFSAQQRSTFRRDESFWNWKYQENPFGKALLTLAEVDNKIVGVDNLWPWEFHIDRSLVRALQPCDSAVHEDFRGKGIFSAMRKHGLEDAKTQDYDLMFNYPNANSLSVNLALGWQSLGKIAWWVKIMKPTQVIAAKLSAKQAAPVLMDSEYQIDAALIQQVVGSSTGDDSRLRINRRPGFHAWRYEKHPRRSYGMIHYEKGGESTIVLFTINQKGPSREMLIVDLLGSAQNTLQAVKMALSAARKMGVAYVAVMNNPEFETRELWKAGFIKQRLKNMVVLPLNPDLEGKVNHFSNWSLMAGMHDSI